MHVPSPPFRFLGSEGVESFVLRLCWIVPYSFSFVLVFFPSNRWGAVDMQDLGFGGQVLMDSFVLRLCRIVPHNLSFVLVSWTADIQELVLFNFWPEKTG